MSILRLLAQSMSNAAAAARSSEIPVCASIIFDGVSVARGYGRDISGLLVWYASDLEFKKVFVSTFLFETYDAGGDYSL